MWYRYTFIKKVIEYCTAKNLVMVTIVILTGACSHSLEVKNIDNYAVVNGTALDEECTFGVVPKCTNLCNQAILNSVGDNLRRYGAEVVMPYHKNGPRKVNVIADIELQSDYDGSIANFFICWPGFIVFAPAWNGYVYTIEHSISVNLADGETGQHLERFTIPVELKIRHADFERTFWSEGMGWCGPGLSAIALCAAPFQVGYDEGITYPAAEEVEDELGNYIAQEIVRRTNSHIYKIKASGSEAPASVDG